MHSNREHFKYRFYQSIYRFIKSPRRFWDITSSALYLLSFCTVLTIIPHCTYYHSALYLLSFCTVINIILHCTYYHSALYLLSFCTVLAIILHCTYYHSALYLLSFCTVLTMILHCTYYHSWFHRSQENCVAETLYVNKDR